MTAKPPNQDFEALWHDELTLSRAKNSTHPPNKPVTVFSTDR
jgi:hypothetical protein